MKLIKQYCYLDDQTDFSILGIKKFIEKQAKTCYQSTHTITEDSYEKFVQRMIDSDHSRTLEFATVHLLFPLDTFYSIIRYLAHTKDYSTQWFQWNIDGLNSLVYVSTNYRYYLRIYDIFKKTEYDLDKFITYSNNDKFPERHTIHFITDRVTMDSFRTHVGMSSIAESTRFCSYNKDKFGNEVTFVIPNWINIPEGEYRHFGGQWCDENDIPRSYDENLAINNFLLGLRSAESEYMILLKSGWKAEQARQLLPLSVKSELVLCGFDDCWNNFLYRRDNPHAHPMARELAKNVRKLLKK